LNGPGGGKIVIFPNMYEWGGLTADAPRIKDTRFSLIYAPGSPLFAVGMPPYRHFTAFRPVEMG